MSIFISVEAEDTKSLVNLEERKRKLIYEMEENEEKL